jgi:hypothetical protein
MQFKEWLQQNETAGDSWFDPTAQPIQWLLRAQINGAPLPGVIDLADFPPGSIKNPYLNDLLAKLARYAKKKGNYSPDKINYRYKNESAIQQKLLKYYLKFKPKTPRPPEFKDGPDTYTNAGWDAVGEPDTGQRATFKVLPHYT